MCKLIPLDQKIPHNDAMGELFIKVFGFASKFQSIICFVEYLIVVFQFFMMQFCAHCASSNVNGSRKGSKENKND